ncbi:MAG: recombinase family protein, partial [Cyanobacteria bacterium REEB65]|nr:recombinase family protein [Cyanobacteria bacterium REEB65]
LLKTYVDVMSARGRKGDRRPSLKRLEADAEARAFEVVLVYKIDRLARSQATFHRLAQDFAEWGVGLVSLTEPIDMSTAAGKAMVGVLALFAEVFSDQLSERVSSAMRHLAAKGRANSGVAPMGYRLEGGAYVVVPEEADIVREVFATFLRERSIRGTADSLNGRRIVTRKGLPWQFPTLRYLLQNRVYLGSTHYGKHEIVHRRTGSTKRPLPPDRWVAVEGTHEAIIEPEVFWAVQTLRAASKGIPSATLGAQERYAYSGLIVCASCGGRAQRVGGSNRGGYMCGNFTRRGKSGCAAYVFLSRSYLDRYVTPAILGALEPLGTASPVRRSAGKATPARRVEALLARKEREKELFRGGFTSYEEMADRLAQLDRDLEALAAPPADRPHLPIPPDLKGFWKVASEKERGDLLRSFVEEIRGDRSEVRIRFKPFPDPGAPDEIVIPRWNLRHTRQQIRLAD